MIVMEPGTRFLFNNLASVPCFCLLNVCLHFAIFPRPGGPAVPCTQLQLKGVVD